MDSILNLEEINLSEGKKQLGLLARTFAKVTEDDPLTIYIGSCPDYSHKGGKYTHRNVGSGVPLLTQAHLATDLPLFKLLSQYDIPFICKVMIADVEAIDEVFCNKFTQGSKDEFLRRCLVSVDSTKHYLIELEVEDNIKKRIHPTTFFQEFGHDRFINIQDRYQRVLQERYNNDLSFETRVRADNYTRRDMYQKMYDTVLPYMENAEKTQFLTGRTLRTMAQYLTLGRLISESSNNSVIIIHPTRNKGVFNERNKFQLEGDIHGQQLPIPIFEMNRKVY